MLERGEAGDKAARYFYQEIHPNEIQILEGRQEDAPGHTPRTPAARPNQGKEAGAKAETARGSAEAQREKERVRTLKVKLNSTLAALLSR